MFSCWMTFVGSMTRATVPSPRMVAPDMMSWFLYRFESGLRTAWYSPTMWSTASPMRWSFCCTTTSRSIGGGGVLVLNICRR